MVAISGGGRADLLIQAAEKNLDSGFRSAYASPVLARATVVMPKTNYTASE